MVPGKEAIARNVNTFDATYKNGLMLYDRYKVYDKSALTDGLKEKVGLETEKINAAMADRGHEQRQFKSKVFDPSSRHASKLTSEKVGD